MCTTTTERYNSEFYGDVVHAGDDDSALLFTRNEQLELLQSSIQVYCDAIFTVIPSIYYQQSFTDVALPVVYALISAKAQALNVEVFEKVEPVLRLAPVPDKCTQDNSPPDSTPGQVPNGDCSPRTHEPPKQTPPCSTSSVTHLCIDISLSQTVWHTRSRKYLV